MHSPGPLNILNPKLLSVSQRGSGDLWASSFVPLPNVAISNDSSLCFSLLAVSLIGLLRMSYQAWPVQTIRESPGSNPKSSSNDAKARGHPSSRKWTITLVISGKRSSSLLLDLPQWAASCQLRRCYLLAGCWLWSPRMTSEEL